VATLTLVRLPRMTKHEIDNLVKEQIICRIAFMGAEHPYIAPFQYTVMNGFLYFHFTDYGRKMKLLNEGRTVCVEVEQYQPDLSEYKFVVLSGKLKIVTDFEERFNAIKKMVAEAKKRLSPNFLVAHGFSKDAGWSSLSPDKPITIVKLEEIFEEIGLKYP